MSEFSYDELIDDLTEEELVMLAAGLQDQEALEQEDPLLKDNYGQNLAQVEVTNAIGKYRYVQIIGGNKIGKTHIMAKIVVAACKGLGKKHGINFPFKPPLTIWYGGRDRNILGDEPLKSLKRFLKGDKIDYRTESIGHQIQKMFITCKDGDFSDKYTSEVIFKPYKVQTGGVGTWESGNVNIVVMDEEPPREIFSAAKTKISFTSGIILMTMTPDHGITWSYDWHQGNDPDHSVLFQTNQIKLIQATTFDNAPNFKISQGLEWVRFPTKFAKKRENQKYLKGHQLKKYLEKNDIQLRTLKYDQIKNDADYVEVPDTFADHVNGIAYMSPEYQVRILGLFVSNRGKVYEFKQEIIDEDGNKEPFNTFNSHDGVFLSKFSELKFFAVLDYGYSDPFVCLLIAIDKYDTKYVLQEVYKKYTNTEEQARLMQEMFQNWNVIPEMIVADNQINDKGRIEDKQKPHIQSIKDSYMDYMSYYNFRTEEMDKRDPETKRDKVRRDLVDGKLKFNVFNNYTYQCQQELLKLEYREGSADQVTTGSKKDHADVDACLRMFYGANITYENFQTSEQIAERRKVNRHFQGLVY